MDKKEEVLAKIEEVRIKMNENANKYGLTHPIVLQKSKQLDDLHNMWNKLTLQLP